MTRPYIRQLVWEFCVFDLKNDNSEEQTVSVRKILIPEGVQGLKNVGGTLYSLVGESKVMRLYSSGRWEIDQSSSPDVIFKKPIPVYSNAYLTVVEHNNRLKLTTADGLLASWDRNSRRFKMDEIRDFAVNDGRLLTLNKQSAGAVSFNAEGFHSGYLAAQEDLNRFEVRNGMVYGLGTGHNFLLSRQTVDNHGTWEQVPSVVELDRKDGLGFRQSLILNNGEDSIYPAIGDKILRSFWERGRFSFDSIENIEGGDSYWWTVTPVGLVCNKGLDGVKFIDLHGDIPQTTRLKHHDGRLHLEIGGQEYLFISGGEGEGPQNCIGSNCLQSDRVRFRTGNESTPIFLGAGHHLRPELAAYFPNPDGKWIAAE